MFIYSFIYSFFTFFFLCAVESQLLLTLNIDIEIFEKRTKNLWTKSSPMVMYIRDKVSAALGFVRHRDIFSIFTTCVIILASRRVALNIVWEMKFFV